MEAVYGGLVESGLIRVVYMKQEPGCVEQQTTDFCYRKRGETTEMYEEITGQESRESWLSITNVLKQPCADATDLQQSAITPTIPQQKPCWI